MTHYEAVMELKLSTDDGLKPCPFCGGKAKIHNAVEFASETAKLIFGKRCGVHCTKCSVATMPYDSLDDAIAAWNRRVEAEIKEGEDDA